MEYMSTLLVVRDMQASKAFYTSLLGMQVTLDLGANVVLNGQLALQTAESWLGFVDAAPGDIRYGGLAAELYYETEDLDAFLARLEKDWPAIEMVCPLKTFPWGQRSVHMYDPDRHCVEVGESMKTVAKRYLLQGLADEEVQQRVMYPMEFVLMCKEELQKEGKL